mmetsp:Transcript_96072/g.228796  ORF Transcript_96072/g.228796 Transcript_96072/m.228796 type:complete len:185 (+) Transcript_96072:45-599(+)
MMQDAKESLRATFRAAEELIEKKKVQVALAQEETERERLQLELEWSRIKWQQEALGAERRALQRLRAQLEAQEAEAHPVVEEYQTQVRGRRGACFSEEPSGVWGFLAAAATGSWLESCSCPSGSTRQSQRQCAEARTSSALPVTGSMEELYFAPPPRLSKAPCMPSIREEEHGEGLTSARRGGA